MAGFAIPVRDIARLLEGEFIGDPDLVVTGFARLSDAGPSDISFLDNEKYTEDFHQTRAGVVIVGQSIDPAGKSVIRVSLPYAAFARVLQAYAPPTPCPFPGVSSGAYVDPSASVGEGARIGPNVYIGPEAVIGDHTILWPGVSIGPRARVGAHCLLHANAVVYHGCSLGDRVIVHSGAVIGADGFGFAPEGERYLKIPQIGNVVVEDDVEIGANTTIDRAALGSTLIGRGTKIDNLVMVAHNCQIGENSILVAQVGVSGSTELGRHVVLAGQVGVCGHVRIGDFVRIGAQSGVTKDIAEGQEVLGAPAIPVSEFKRIQAHIRKLPDLRDRVKELEAKVAELSQIIEQLRPRGTELPAA